MLNSLKTKFAGLGKASQDNTEAALEKIQAHRSDYQMGFKMLMTLYGSGLSKDSRKPVLDALRKMKAHRQALGLNGYDLLSVRKIKQLIKTVKSADMAAVSRVLGLLAARQSAQVRLDADLDWAEIPSAAHTLREADAKLLAQITPRWEQAAWRANHAVFGTVTAGLHAAITPVGWVAEKIAAPLLRARGVWQGGRVARISGHIIGGFLSRDALARTGFETSWGVRFIVPGTAGFIGNAGPWVMFYTGQLRDYQKMAVPFRVNPGATLATDLATFTQNRPGFGAGTATPLASGYVDAARSKLLVGRDGVLYVRVGEWEGRGAYFTVSAFIPLTPWMHITWNASLFSPGWRPVVAWSRPATLWVRGQADWLWTKLTSPFRKGR